MWLRAEGVANPRPEGNTSGTLCLELWGFSEPYAGGEPRGQRLAGIELGSVWGKYRLPDVERLTAFAPPPSGRWHVSMLLREWTRAQGYTTRDHRNFDVVYEQAAPEQAAPAPAPAPTPLASARATEKLRLIKPGETPAAAAAAPVAAATPVAAAAPAPAAAAAPATPAAASVPAAAKNSGVVSVNTASIEDLAKLPGMSLKVAKEIVKNRPFASLEGLVQVRGVGDKTLRRIKSLLTL